jgi:curli biogenesis system outer membrane secretion channel CsgG
MNWKIFHPGRDRLRMLCALALATALSACQPPKESSTILVPSVVAVKNTPFSGTKLRVAVGRFENRSTYQNGIFYDGVDRLGMEAQQNLATHLAQSNRFVVVDRINMAETAREATIGASAQKLTAADVIFTGAVTEFGRRETGTMGLGGILQQARTQTAYAKVTISAVDVKTSEILYSVQGSGTFDLTNEHVLGFGSDAGFDATLTDKVLNLAMIEAVNHLIDGLEKKAW